MQIISIIISIVMLYVIYYIFEKYNFKTALIVNGIYGIIVSIINNGFNILAIIIGLVVTTIELFILALIYKRSKSFGDFLIKVIFVGLILGILIFAISFIIGSMFEPKLG